MPIKLQLDILHLGLSLHHSRHHLPIRPLLLKLAGAPEIEWILGLGLFLQSVPERVLQDIWQLLLVPHVQPDLLGGVAGGNADDGWRGLSPRSGGTHLALWVLCSQAV